jgi:hypothetical protein
MTSLHFEPHEILHFCHDVDLLLSPLLDLFGMGEGYPEGYLQVLRNQVHKFPKRKLRTNLTEINNMDSMNYSMTWGLVALSSLH